MMTWIDCFGIVKRNNIFLSVTAQIFETRNNVIQIDYNMH